MPRHKIIPDSSVLDLVLARLETQGSTAVSFAAIADQSGLAASTLVQRFRTKEGMVAAALAHAWAKADTDLEALEAALPLNAKGAKELLKRLAAFPAPLSVAFANEDSRQAAMAWRARVERALALRLGGAEADSAAAALFAWWQGEALWRGGSERAPKFKGVFKRFA